MISIVRILFLLVVIAMIAFIGCKSPWVSSANIYLEQQNNPDKAEEALQKALEQNPNDPEAHYLMGRVHLMKKRYKEMVSSFNRSLELSTRFESDINRTLDDEWTSFYNDGGVRNFSKGTVLRKIAQIMRTSGADRQRGLSRCLLELDDFSDVPDSVSRMEWAIQYRRTCSETFESGDLDQTAQRLDSKSADFYNASIGELNTAILILPTRWETYNLMAMAYENLQNIDKAAEFYKQAIDRQTGPKEYPLYYNYANALFRLKKYDESNRYATIVIEGTTEDELRLDALKVSATSLSNMGRSEDAVKMYDEIIKSAPDDPNLYYDRALLSLELQDTTLALQGFQKTLELNPNDLDAMKQLGLIFIDGGTFVDYSKALDYYQRANAVEPHSYNTVRGIGKAMVKLGRAEEAAPYLEEAAVLYKDLQRK